jgi:hypothetical protein
MADRATDMGLAGSAPHRPHRGAGEASSASETTASAEGGAAITEGNNASALLNEDVQDAADEPKAVPDEARTDRPAPRLPARRAPRSGKKKTRRGVAVPALLEAARTSSEPGSETRFRVFVIDTGWNETAHRVLRKQIPLFDTLIGDTPAY